MMKTAPVQQSDTKKLWANGCLQPELLSTAALCWCAQSHTLLSAGLLMHLSLLLFPLQAVCKGTGQHAVLSHTLLVNLVLSKLLSTSTAGHISQRQAAGRHGWATLAAGYRPRLPGAMHLLSQCSTIGTQQQLQLPCATLRSLTHLQQCRWQRCSSHPRPCH